jgi:ribosome maturation factor RimP
LNARIDIDAVERIASEAARGNGLALYDVEVTSERGRTILRVLVDRVVDEPQPEAVTIDDETQPEGVTINECVDLSRELSLLLDAEDAVGVQYVLEVSSPGVERQLTKAHHFVRAVGEQVLLILNAEHEGRTSYEGVLEDVHDDLLELRLPPKRKRRKKGQLQKETPIEEWERAEIRRDAVHKAKTIYAFSNQ